MKNLNVLRSMLIIAFGFLLVQCTSEYELVQGPPGADGIDGIDGVDGVDGTASCVSCHSNAFRDPIREAYAASKHGSGSTWASRGTSAVCSRCHNNEGLIDILSVNFIDSTGLVIPNPDGYAVGNPINCSGCHDMHRSFDFENDGNDKAVRSLAAVDLFLDPTVQIDIRNSSDELGKSNLCVNCHQPRNSYAIPAGTEDYEITSSRFGPHHGPQSTILEGIMGANIPGSVGYPGVGAAGHRSGSSCVACHMGPTTDGTDGGHTWQPTENTCVVCHTSGPPSAVTDFAADMATLKALLIAEGTLLDNDRTVPGVYSANVAKATWNYRTLLEDQSMGVHNPNYAKALLKNSIEALQN
jgi:hypothetical protein